MLSGGFLPLSLSDFPGIPAAVVFLQGCNWRCRYCHNRSLLPMRQGDDHSRQLISNIEKRKKLIQGVVITGGEPTLQHDIAQFMLQIKAMGLQVKLDTNGSKPDFLQQLITNKIPDYIAMDIKSPWEQYRTLTGIEVDTTLLKRSVELIATSDIPHQFRTTFAPHLITESNLQTIAGYIPQGSSYIVNPYKDGTAN